MVFGKQRRSLVGPLSPTKRKHASTVTPEEESFLASLLDNLYSSLPRRQRGYVQEHMFGGGGNGIACVGWCRRWVGPWMACMVLPPSRTRLPPPRPAVHVHRYLESDRHQVATDGDVSVFFKGALRSTFLGWPRVGAA